MEIQEILLEKNWKIIFLTVFQFKFKIQRFF